MTSIVLLACVVLPLQAPTPRAVEGLSNGDFELISPSGTLGTTTNPVDGGFWVGAEGRTLVSANDRVFRSPGASGAFAFQEVGCAPGKGASLSLSAQVRPSAANDEGWVTLLESSGESDALTKSLYGCNPPNAPWAFYEELTTGNLTSLAICTTSNPSGNALDGFRCTVATGAVVVEWTAPHAGTVRVVGRAPRYDANSSTVLHEIKKGTSYSTATLVRSDVLAANDANGSVVLARVAVSAGTKIWFRALRQGSGNATFEWDPQVAYEGRRLTWRFSTSSTQPTDTSTQAWIHVPSTVGQWNTITNVQAGVAFQTAFGALPKPPYEIEIGAPASNGNRVDLDDVSLKCDFDYVSANKLRRNILDEAMWARDLIRLRRDRSTSYVPWYTGPGPWQLGSVATPYSVHGMKTQGGPQQASCSVPPGTVVRGVDPVGLESLLFAFYDDRDYEDYFWIRENERRQKEPATELLYTEYDVCTDAYTHASDETTGGGVIDRMIALWERTNDPTCLDVAFAYANVMTRPSNFYYPSSDPNPPGPLIVGAGYKVLDGTNANASSSDWIDYSYLGGASSVVAAYVACKNYNTAHSGGQPRYGTSRLDAQLAAVKASIDTSVGILVWVKETQTYGSWVPQTWHDLLGYFSDWYGYMRISATEGMLSLRKLTTALTADEQHVHDQLKLGILESGATFHLPMWEQQVIRADQAAGDQSRCWDAYVLLSQEVPPPSLATRYADAALRAAFNAVRFQYDGGYWVTAGQNEHQRIEISGNFGSQAGSPPAMYPRGIAQMFRLGTLTSSQRDDLLAILETIRSTTVAKFKQPYGYQSLVSTPPGTDELGGREGRFIDNYVSMIDILPTSLPAKPEATVAPASLITPASGGETFVFTVHVPAATTTTELHDALSRVKIQRWRTISGAWQVETLWPDQPSFFAGTPVESFAQKTITFTAAAPIGAGAGEFKFDVHAWDVEGQWDRDTSYQSNW